MATLVDKRKIDCAGAFLVFMATVGDVSRTALATDLPEETIRQLAASESWNDKIKAVTLAAKTGGMQASEFFILQNRAVSFVMASRMRSVLDKVLCALQEKTSEELIDDITEEDKLGNKRVNARVFSDLSRAIAEANGLAFLSLGDSAAERKASAPNEAENTAAIHASLIACLNAAGAKGKASELLVAEVAQALDIEVTLVPTSPPIERKKLAAPPSEGPPAIG